MKDEFDYHFQMAEQFHRALARLDTEEFLPAASVLVREGLKCYLRSALCLHGISLDGLGLYLLWSQAAARELVAFRRPDWLVQISGFGEGRRKQELPAYGVMLDGLRDVREATIQHGRSWSATLTQ